MTVFSPERYCPVCGPPTELVNGRCVAGCYFPTGQEQAVEANEEEDDE